MLEADDELTEAVERDTVVWRPTLAADWGRDGYGEDGSIDDLSDQQEEISVAHSLFDGLPEEVSFLDQTGVPTLRASLTGREVDGREMNATQYFSPFRTDSPLHGVVRDGTPVKAEQGATTEDGPQRLRLFTGQIDDISTPPNSPARVSASSTTRLALSVPVQPPPIVASLLGWGSTEELLTGAWLVSWILHRCGVHPSPPAVPGCLLWAPLHGGYWSFLQGWDVDLESPLAISGMPTAHFSTFDSIPSEEWRQALPRWVRGPYVAGLNGYVEDDHVRGIFAAVSDDPFTTDVDREPTHLDNSPKWFRQDENTGRLQMYIRGDDVDWSNISPEVSGGVGVGQNSPWRPANTFPGPPVGTSDIGALDGVTNDVVAWGVCFRQSCVDTEPSLAWWIDQTDRKVRLKYRHGATTHTLTSTGALPTDGKWHFFGIAWSIANGRLAINLDSVVDHYSSSNISASATGLAEPWPGPSDVFPIDSTLMWDSQFVPLSEWQFSSGPEADPVLNPTWLPDIEWERKAQIYPSSLNMAAVAFPEPREAYEALQAIARAEVANLTIDGSDVLHYRPLGYYATPEQQATGETITTDRHAQTPDIRLDSTRLRNQVVANYRRTRTDFQEPALNFRTVLEAPFGSTTYRIPLDYMTTFTLNYDAFLYLLSDGELALFETGVLTLQNMPNFATLNTAEDGSGELIAQATGLARARIAAFRSHDIELTLTNFSRQTLYLVNQGVLVDGSPMTYINLLGAVITSQETALETYQASVDERGSRFLSMALPWPHIGSDAEASQVARRVLGLTAKPQAIASGVQVFGDPRREPGDLARFQDPDQTGIDELMRSAEVIHNIGSGGANYTQTVRLQQARQVGVWGQSRWGECLWAGRENPGIYGEEDQ